MKTLQLTCIIFITLILSSCGRSTPPHPAHGDSTAVQQTGEYYTCVMHPQIHSDKPGQCPICHMDLIKVSASGKQKTDTASVSVDSRGQQLANVAMYTVGMEPVEQTIHASGTLEIPEPNKAMISARFSGRIEKLYVQAVGVAVKKGQPLFDIYSPDIIQAETEYLQAAGGGFSGARPSAQTGMPGDQAGAKAPMTLLATARSKLQLLGMTDDQIRTLEANGKAALVFTYHSPASGIVVDKKIVDGMYITEGLPLFEVSDMSVLWNIADVFEADAGRLRVGDRAEIKLQTGTEHVYPAVISFIYPVVDPQSRTIQVRLSVNNTHGELRPNTYTETVFKEGRGNALTVPVTAVLVTGKRNIVYVKSSDNTFEARNVGVGVRFNGRYEITRGLRAGDVIVSEGGYLIDSESQLKSGTGT